jgi:UDP-N-acetylmuramate--alanine ligase
MFFEPKAMHFTGIGGIGMSGLAELALSMGCAVSGSDLVLSDTTARLERLGIHVVQGHRAENLGEAEVLVVTSAADSSNPELVEARRRKLPIVRRGELLAEFMRPRRGVAIGGSHGKTTTTAMAAAIAIQGGLDPTVVVGGKVPELGGANVRVGKGRVFLAESDESDGSFLELSPVMAVITNIDREHLDHYGDFDHARRAFLDFANKVPYYGVTILCLDDAHVLEMLPEVRRRVVTYGEHAQADVLIRSFSCDSTGSRFELSRDGKDLGAFRLTVLGAHNVRNATAAVTVGLELGIEPGLIREALAEFRGVGRRMEVKGRRGGITVIDDYGHHPTEIRATLEALRLTRPARLVVVFQPHRYTRTQQLMEEFSTAFGAATALRVMEIYPASEPPIEGVTGAALAERIAKMGAADVKFTGNLEETADSVAKELRHGDVVVTLGAGSVTKVGPMLLERVQEA